MGHQVPLQSIQRLALLVTRCVVLVTTDMIQSFRSEVVQDVAEHMMVVWSLRSPQLWIKLIAHCHLKAFFGTVTTPCMDELVAHINRWHEVLCSSHQLFQSKLGRLQAREMGADADAPLQGVQPHTGLIGAVLSGFRELLEHREEPAANASVLERCWC